MWRESDQMLVRRAAAVAAGRHGVITTALLHRICFSSSAISRWEDAGFLHRQYRGVYALGHPSLSLEGRWTAAVDACGEGAVLSHLAAASLWGLLDWKEHWPVDVTVPRRSGRRQRDGIRLHRSSTLAPGHVTERDAIPVTNVPRLLRDLPRFSTPKELREACRQAEIAGWRNALPEGHVPNRSDLELAMFALCKRHRLPIPRTRVRIGAYEADFLFEGRLVIETDGWETHGTRQAFEDDREREVELSLLGYETHRFTWRQISEKPAWVAASLRSLLAGPRRA